MKKTILLSLGSLLLLLAGGCQFLGIGPNPEKPLDLALIAAAVADYNDEVTVASIASMDKDDYEGTVDGSSAKGLVRSQIRTLPDGTSVTITWELIENDPDDPEDDEIKITRVFERMSGETLTEILIRPLKPRFDWTGWDENDQIVQTGSTEVYLEDTKIKWGTLTALWQRTDTDVYLARLVRELDGVGGLGIIHRTISEWDADGLETRTQTRIRLSKQEEIVVHTLTFTDEDIDGVIYTKILREDGFYALVRKEINPGDPRVIEYYDSFDVLRIQLTITIDPETRAKTIVRQYYDEEGNEIGEPITAEVTYEYIDGKIVVTKIIGDRQIVISVREDAENGYEIVRNGFTYYVVFAGDDVEIYDDERNLIGTVRFNEDGTTTIVYPDASTETITL